MCSEISGIDLNSLSREELLKRLQDLNCVSGFGVYTAWGQ